MESYIANACSELLGLSVSILTIVTYRGKHFTVINDVSLDTNSSYRTLHTIVFYTGICLSIILTIAALVGIVGTVRELESAMAVVSSQNIHLKWDLGNRRRQGLVMGFTLLKEEFQLGAT
ncbi:Tetraspanin-32 [Varanus komodoensis]|nr:Tetraspanin-32 [Varanus komodoensis]